MKWQRIDKVSKKDPYLTSLQGLAGAGAVFFFFFLPPSEGSHRLA